MTPEFIVELIRQFPTFLGLLLLAYVQYTDRKRQDERFDRLLDTLIDCTDIDEQAAERLRPRS